VSPTNSSAHLPMPPSQYRLARQSVYFTDRGIEELADRRGAERVTMAWLAERLRDFVDLNPGFETAVDRLASWLARLDDDEDL
jgi:hypothetical protein